jgi:hypothetical protein
VTKNCGKSSQNSTNGKKESHDPSLVYTTVPIGQLCHLLIQKERDTNIWKLSSHLARKNNNNHSITKNNLVLA